MINKRILTVALISSFSTFVFASPRMNIEKAMTNHFYLALFGGGGVFSTNSINQKGTAYYSASNGGPLYVNAQGDGSTEAIGVGGMHVGYEWSSLSKDRLENAWTFVPAIELEGYYLGGTQQGSHLNNPTNRLPEHNFSVSYPMNTGVFLANAVLTLGQFAQARFHPYIGAGIGAAIVSISGANSTQTAPAEPGVNHYNSNPNQSDWTFATQAKLGLRYNLSLHSSLFVEYRFLYLSPTQYTFGSTQYSTHVATSNWNVHIGGLYNNMGIIGFQFDL